MSRSFLSTSSYSATVRPPDLAFLYFFSLEFLYIGTVISVSPTNDLSFTTPIMARLRQRDTGLRATADPSLLVESLLDLGLVSSRLFRYEGLNLFMNSCRSGTRSDG